MVNSSVLVLIQKIKYFNRNFVQKSLTELKKIETERRNLLFVINFSKKKTESKIPYTIFDSRFWSGDMGDMWGYA